MGAVIVVPVGRPDPKTLRMLAEDLSAAGFTVSVADPEPLPPAGYEPRRGQHRGMAVLKQLSRHAHARVLGVTDADLFTDGLNFVFGVAESSGRLAVIALPRLRIGASDELYRTRVITEAIHELGHTFGLDHCRDPICVMHFSNSLADTDRKRKDFCSRCRTRLSTG